jgi:hypothetical protein
MESYLISDEIALNFIGRIAGEHFLNLVRVLFHNGCDFENLFGIAIVMEKIFSVHPDDIESK